VRPDSENNMNQDASSGHGPKPVTIVVNGEQHVVPKEEISFDEVVALAFPGAASGPDVIYSISYRRGHSDNQKGILAEGGSVKVKDGMVFDVLRTDKS
jgi:hypothetical protein